MADGRSQEVRAGLRTALLTTAGLPEDQALEGWHYVAKNGVPYFTEQWQPATTRPIELGPAPVTRMVGLYRVTCFLPIGAGNAALDLLVDAVVASFPLGTPILTANHRITIEYAQRGDAKRDRDFIAASVTISWHSDPT